jgi:hypothetical protein
VVLARELTADIRDAGLNSREEKLANREIGRVCANMHLESGPTDLP